MANYLEVDSSYRDRTKWPLPGQFEIPVTQSGVKGKLEALDPVCLSSSIISWMGNNFVYSNILNNQQETISVKVIDANTRLFKGISSSSTQSSVFITTDEPGKLQPIADYYTKAVIRFNVSVNTNVPTPHSTASCIRIMKYVFLGNDTAQITLETPMDLYPGDELVITDPTDLSSSSFPMFFVPNGNNDDNSYSNMILYNETVNESRKIKQYDSSNRILTVITTETALSNITTGPTTNWKKTDSFSIRASQPWLTGQLYTYTNLPENPSSTTSFNFPYSLQLNQNPKGDFLEITSELEYQDIYGTIQGVYPGGAELITLDASANPLDDFYVGAKIVLLTSLGAKGATSTIIKYNGTSKQARINPGFSNPIGGNFYVIIFPKTQARKIIKFVNETGTITSAGSIYHLELGNSASKTEDYYNNIYITITSGVNAGVVKLIKKYSIVNGVKQAYLFSPLNVLCSPGDNYTVSSGIVTPSFTSSLGNNKCKILPFSKDNLCPFNYNNVPSNDTGLYEIQLLNLSLPNQTLSTGNGSIIAFYPYVYVELTNNNNSASSITFQSNNPHSTNMKFRAVINDIANPEINRYVNIGSDMTCTVNFKHGDTLTFSVRLPTGEIYNTVVDETFSPNAPNPKIQISALFSIRQVERKKC